MRRSTLLRWQSAFAAAGAIGIVVWLASTHRHRDIVLSAPSAKQAEKSDERGAGGVDRDSPRAIIANDSMVAAFALGGAVFGLATGPEQITVNASTSLIHSFSPYTERRFRSMMIDPPKEHKIYANSPAIVWHRGQLVVVMRIWLEKERYDWAPPKPKNTFSDNYFYAQTFDDRFRPLDSGRMVGIPTPNQWSIGDGPIEPRAVVVGGTLYVTFNTGVVLSSGGVVDSTFLWNFDDNEAILPSIEGGAPMQRTAPTGEMPRDKHWSAFVQSGGRLHFAYNLDPLRILRCLPANGTCSFVHFEGPADYRFGDSSDVLRGGTPLVRYLDSPYFVTVVHVTLFKNCPSDANCHWKRYYTANLLVLRTQPMYKVVYCSEPLQFHRGFLRDVPIVRSRYIKDPFVFPVGLILENADTLAIGGHVNDYSSYVFRLRGLKQIMDHVIRLDRGGTSDGPAVGALHEWARRAAKRYSGYEFM